jgi:hypothetical protein
MAIGDGDWHHLSIQFNGERSTVLVDGNPYQEVKMREAKYDPAIPLQVAYDPRGPVALVVQVHPDGAVHVLSEWWITNSPPMPADNQRRCWTITGGVAEGGGLGAFQCRLFNGHDGECDFGRGSCPTPSEPIDGAVFGMVIDHGEPVVIQKTRYTGTGPDSRRPVTSFYFVGPNRETRREADQDLKRFMTPRWHGPGKVGDIKTFMRDNPQAEDFTLSREALAGVVEMVWEQNRKWEEAEKRKVSPVSEDAAVRAVADSIRGDKGLLEEYLAALRRLGLVEKV